MSSALMFRLTAATIALFSEEDRQVARAIPKGSVIRVNASKGEKLVEVAWDGKTALMFAQDIAERGERVTGAA